MKIENIKLFTSEFEKTFQFYEEILECPVWMIGQEAFTVKIGDAFVFSTSKRRCPTILSLCD